MSALVIIATIWAYSLGAVSGYPGIMRGMKSKADCEKSRAINRHANPGKCREWSKQ